VLTALCLGGAAGVWAEAADAKRLFTPDVIIASNHAGRDLEGPLDHWCSFHVELMPAWIAAREAAGRPPAGRLWSVERRFLASTTLDVHRVKNWGGSSGLLAVTVALELGCTHVVLAGTPLDIAAAHYDDPKPWRDAGQYRRAWLAHRTLMTGVRSMSGWTREILGAPDREWLHGDGSSAPRRDPRSDGDGGDDDCVPAAPLDGRVDAARA
jgi:hypothetical protein